MICSFRRRSGMAHVNEGSHSFTCHPPIYPYLPLLSSHRPSPHNWLVLFSRPAEGRRLSWPGWLLQYWNGCPPDDGQPVSLLAAAGQNRTRDHRLTTITFVTSVSQFDAECVIYRRHTTMGLQRYAVVTYTTKSHSYTYDMMRITYGIVR